MPNTETLKLLSKEFDVSINTLLGTPRQLVCQCCGMPLEDAIISHNKDGSPNEDYCKWCYADGTYTYSSIQTTQEVEIYFNFVGRFVPPAFGEVELTPEELEEIRKREERKDRLHQNYLKRKASGAQKRYEDKIKERKKAEIEAKKAAIRAEDIAKGVFVPVSSLPQREPMKGVQSA